MEQTLEMAMMGVDGGETESPSVTVVILARPPRLLASLVRESAFNIARAGEPSPFATPTGRQGGP